jgi:hypothetical protein
MICGLSKTADAVTTSGNGFVVAASAARMRQRWFAACHKRLTPLLRAAMVL